MSEALARMNDATAHSWTVDSLRDYVLGLMSANDSKYRERHDALRELIVAREQVQQQHFTDAQRAVDIAFSAQQAGLAVALTAQKDAVAAALIAAEKAVSAAMAAADRAVLKAEFASEKRFEGVNEFRETLADQQRLLIPRAEVEALLRASNEKVALNQEALQLLAERLTGNMLTKEGQTKGLNAGWAMAVGIVGLIALIIGLLARFAKV